MLATTLAQRDGAKNRNSLALRLGARTFGAVNYWFTFDYSLPPNSNLISHATCNPSPLATAPTNLSHLALAACLATLSRALSRLVLTTHTQSLLPNCPRRGFFQQQDGSSGLLQSLFQPSQVRINPNPVGLQHVSFGPALVHLRMQVL